MLGLPSPLTPRKATQRSLGVSALTLLNAAVQELIVIDRNQFNLLEAYISLVESPRTVDSTLSNLRLLPWLEIGIVSTLPTSSTSYYGLYPLLEGLTEYAREQQNWETTTCERLAMNWAKIREKGRAYLAQEMVVGMEVLVLLNDEEEQIGDDGEEGPPDYKDEGDNKILD
jgi:hypothetical protein